MARPGKILCSIDRGKFFELLAACRAQDDAAATAREWFKVHCFLLAYTRYAQFHFMCVKSSKSAPRSSTVALSHIQVRQAARIQTNHNVSLHHHVGTF